MMKLIPFELGKFWRKKNFCMVMAALFLVNLFFLWFLSQPEETAPGLSDYKKLHQELAAKEEPARGTYLAQRYEEIEGCAVVEEILMYQAREDAFAKRLEQQAMEQHPGVFETYYQWYLSGDYLRYTSSLTKERTLLDTV